jgi:hypothetical protein
MMHQVFGEAYASSNVTTRPNWGVCDATEREFVTSNDKLRTVAYRYIIEASIDVS